MAKRGRPPKQKTTVEKTATKEQINTIENALGEPLEEFARIFTDDNKRKLFAENLSKQLKKTQTITELNASNGKYQPVFSEQLFQQMNINPAIASSSQIEKWLMSPQYFDQNLRHLGQYLSYSVGQYNRAIWYLNTIKTYKYKLLPSDSDIEGTIDTNEYLHAYDICLRTLQKMNIRYQIPKVDLQTMYDGVSFYWISETDDTISLLPIPTDYCYITAPWTYGYLFAIDLVYFDRYLSMIEQIPELKTAYNNFVKMREKKLEGDALAPFQYYQVPPDKGWCFSFNPIMPDKVPPLVSSMSASLDILSYKELLKNKIALDLYKIIPMKIPLDKENKQLAISYKLAEEITQVIQSLLPENVKVFSSPFETANPVTTDQSDRFGDIVDVSNDTFYASGGLTKSMFGSKDNKTAGSMAISQNIDFAYASLHQYKQYENFINFQLSLKTKKYKFQIQMYGNLQNDTEERELALKEMNMSSSGILDFYSAKGYEPFQVKSVMLLEKALGLRELMIPIQSTFTTSSKSSSPEGGKPKQTQVEDSGQNTKEYDSNKYRFSQDVCIHCGKPIRNAYNNIFCSEDCAIEYAENILNNK